MDRLNNFRRQGYDKVKNEDEGESLLERDTLQPGNLHPKMDYDSILAEIGEFGRWQQMIQALLWIPAIFCGVNGLMFSFTGLQPTNGFRCKIPDCDGDDFKFTDFSADLFPSESDGDPDYCKFYRPLPTDPSFPGNCSHEGFSDEVMECGSNVEYTYNAFQFEETLVTKWNLVCGQQFKVSLVISMYMFGLMSGSLLCGRMADKFGRKKTLVFCVLWASTTSLLGCFMPEYYSYTATRFLTAIGEKGTFLCTFSLAMEVLGSKETVPFLPWVTYQTFFGVLIQAPYALGMALLTLLASWTSSWFTLQLTASLAMFIQLGLWFVLPESPRWLIVTSRTKEAELLIRKAAERNGKQLSDKSLGFDIELKPKDFVPNAPVDQKAAFKELFNPHLLKITIVLFISWPIVTLGYYGITFGMASLSDDLFMDFAMSSLIEIPSYVLVLLLMDIIGRKPIFSGSLLLTGISCIIVGTMDKNGDYANFRRVLAMTGKFFASGTLAIVYVYTAELYPTAIRSTAIGSCSFMAKVGGIISPYVGLYLPGVTMPSIPFYLMGGIAIFGGFLSLLLPESLGSSLPETMEDVDEMKKNGKPFWKCMNPCSG